MWSSLGACVRGSRPGESVGYGLWEATLGVGSGHEDRIGQGSTIGKQPNKALNQWKNVFPLARSGDCGSDAAERGDKVDVGPRHSVSRPRRRELRHEQGQVLSTATKASTLPKSQTVRRLHTPAEGRSATFGLRRGLLSVGPDRKSPMGGLGLRETPSQQFNDSSSAKARNHYIVLKCHSYLFLGPIRSRLTTSARMLWASSFSVACAGPWSSAGGRVDDRGFPKAGQLLQSFSTSRRTRRVIYSAKTQGGNA